MGSALVQKPQQESARTGDSPTSDSAGWRSQLQRSLQSEGFEASKARLAPQAMPVPELRAAGKAPDAEVDEVSHRPGKGTTARAVYDNNQKRAEKATLKRKGYEGELDGFAVHWEKHQSRYEAVAAKTGVPAKLIASIHWRESHGNFKTYLHQGDPLGKKAVHEPKNIPIFNVWEDAAVHALNLKKGIRDKVKMDENTTDPAALATYAEHYNGLGYHNRGKPSAYVWAGTDQYTSGKFVADGKYSSKTRDRQAGVMALMSTADSVDAKRASAGG